MRKRAIYCLGASVLIVQMLFSNSLPCHATEIGTGAYSTADESEAEQPPASAITAVSVSPTTTVVSKGASYAFVASVTGRNNYSSEISWSVHGQTSQNTYIDGNGILYVGSDETSSSLIVKAVSKQDGSYSATALATVQTVNYSIQVKASLDKGGAVSGGGTVKEGGYTVLTATPNSGYIFEGWLLNNNKVSSDSRYTVENIHSDGVYIAEFKPIDCWITVNVNNTNAGTVTESRTVKYGESITLEAQAKDGYRFDGWTENGVTVSTDDRWELHNITGSRTLTAMFSQTKYNISIICGPASAGTVSGQGTYDKGSDVKIKAAPIDGYRFVSWSDNGNVISANAEYTISGISSDMFLVASFEKAQTYTITAEGSSPNGKIVPEGKSVVSEGTGISYVIIPQEGYSINAVYVDGKSMGAISSYNFSDVKGNHTISADFVVKPGQDNGGTKINQADETNKEDNKVSPDDKEEEARIDETDILTAAIESGDLKVIVYNDFVDTAAASSDHNPEEASGVRNLRAMVDDLMTEEEKIEVLQGQHPVIITLSIDDTDGEESQSTVEYFEENKLPGMTIGHYFEISLAKTEKNGTRSIGELSQEVEVQINVPQHLKADNREFYILRLHAKENGSQEFAQLPDKDNNPDTITFSTDRFSPYAIAYIDWPAEKTESAEPVEDTANHGVVNVVAIMAVAIAVVLTFGLLWYIGRKKKR